MNSIISLSPDYATMSVAEIAELEAWFDMVDKVNDEAEAAWNRFAQEVDAGAL